MAEHEQRGVPFGRYQIRQKLGRGGMGEVFLADQLGPLGPVRPVALKRMLPRLAGDRAALQLFLEEMGTAAQLNHPNIATTYDFGEVEGVYFLAMEYVDGVSLDRLIECHGPLPIEAAIEIGRAVAVALEHAHARQQRGTPTPVVHQDVSPHNVMVARDGSVKLLDFGIARAEAAVLGGKLRAKTGYAAPEQLRGAAPDRRFDVWALGVLLYEAITGVRPFRGDDPQALLAAAEAHQFEPASALRPEAARLDPVIDRALEPDPAGRFEGAQTFAIALSTVSEQSADEAKKMLGALVAAADTGRAGADLSESSATGVPALDRKTARALATAGGEAPTRILALPPEAEEPSVTKVLSARRPLRAAAIGGGLIGAVLILALRFAPSGPGSEPAPAPAPVARAPEPAPEPVAPPAPEPVAPPEPVRVQEPAPPVASRPPPLRARPVRNTSRPAPVEPAPPPPPVTKPSEPLDGLGVLAVRTKPWAKVALDGQPLGDGVIAGKPVKAGKHMLTLTPGTGGYKPRSVAIEIRPNLMTKVFVDFETEQLRVE